MDSKRQQLARSQTVFCFFTSKPGPSTFQLHTPTPSIFNPESPAPAPLLSPFPPPESFTTNPDVESEVKDKPPPATSHARYPHKLCMQHSWHFTNPDLLPASHENCEGAPRPLPARTAPLCLSSFLLLTRSTSTWTIPAVFPMTSKAPLLIVWSATSYGVAAVGALKE
ncbi:hypothetical protein M405DRAFT_807297 [Rhizopogon salebrosus TDB-379]|nr:hypothetical protein M405DRAFT_807297 [Rhizopogon salebrosus TDB-379]